MDKPLILLLRNAEWQLNDMAFALMRGHCSPRSRRELAQTITELVPLLRQDPPVVIDQPDQQPNRHLDRH